MFGSVAPILDMSCGADGVLDTSKVGVWLGGGVWCGVGGGGSVANGDGGVSLWRGVGVVGGVAQGRGRCQWLRWWWCVWREGVVVVWHRDGGSGSGRWWCVCGGGQGGGLLVAQGDGGVCEEKGGGEMGGLCRTGGSAQGDVCEEKERRDGRGGGRGVGGVAQGGGQCQWLREMVVCVCEGGGAQGKGVDAVRDGGAEQKNCRSKAKVSKVEPGLHLNRWLLCAVLCAHLEILLQSNSVLTLQKSLGWDLCFGSDYKLRSPVQVSHIVICAILPLGGGGGRSKDKVGGGGVVKDFSHVSFCRNL